MASAPLTIVIGAGISGLTCAYALQKSGLNVLVLEASAGPGGIIQSAAEDGYLFELGPQSFSSTPALYRLCDELGLTGELLEAPHGAPRYVLLGGALTPVPMSPPAFLASGLLDWKTKVAILTEALRTTHPPQPDESIAAFTRRKFSAQLLERLVGPFVSGIYAGDPEQISLRAAFPKLYAAEESAGSLVRGMLRTARVSKATPSQPQRRPGLISFRTGNDAPVHALAGKLGPALRCNVAVCGVSRSGDGFVVKTESAQGAEELSSARVVIATPASTASRLLQNLAPQAGDSLQQIAYAPVAVVSLGYRREQVRHTLGGFGFLAPRSSRIRTLGTVWNSSLFPGRAPHDHVLLTSFVGGATDPSAAALSPQELSGLVHGELTAILGISGEPAMERVTHYAHAIPQYNLGHTARLQVAQNALSSVPGMWVIGNYWNGPAVGACLEHSLEVAGKVRTGCSS